MTKDKIFKEALEKTKADLNIKDLKEAREAVKDIPATNGVLTPIEVAEEKDLAPYPEIEYDVLFDSNLNKLIRNVNTRIGQGRQTEGGIQVVQSNLGTRFYQAMVRRNVDSGLKPEMPSQNPEAGTMGTKPLHIPGLEDEPDLYEDISEDVTDG